MYYYLTLITPNENPSSEEIDLILATFWTDYVVDGVIGMTKEEIIESAKDTKAKFLKQIEGNKDAYDRTLMDPWLQAETDEELYLVERSYLESGHGKFDDQGNLLAFNKNGKHDGYQVVEAHGGGDFPSTVSELKTLLSKKEINEETGEVKKQYGVTSAILYPKTLDGPVGVSDYIWEENVEVDSDWNPIYSNKADWWVRFINIVESLPDDWGYTLVECHI